MSTEQETATPAWHRICPLEELEPMWGEAALVEGSKVGSPTLASPIHKHVYSSETCDCLSEEGPALRTYEVRTEDGQIEVRP